MGAISNLLRHQPGAHFKLALMMGRGEETNVRETPEFKSDESVQNFGRNLQFKAGRYYRPRSESEVLEILNRHSGESIRAVGTLHSWSALPVSEEVVVDLSHFNRVDTDKESSAARVDAGCRIDDLNKRLYEKGLRLPAQPVTSAPTMGGAIATGTHGVGTPSLSHFVEKVRLAAYDRESGEAKVFEIDGGPELRAARCNLGCMGIVLSVQIRCLPEAAVEEKIVMRESIGEVLAEEGEYPLQEFLMIPYRWTFINFQRRMVDEENGDSGSRSLLAPLYHLYTYLNIDLFFNLIVKGLSSSLASAGMVQFFFKHMFTKAILSGFSVRDRSYRMLSLNREIFPHEEAEIFIPGKHLEEAAKLIRVITELFAGLREQVPAEFSGELREAGLLEEIENNRGSYTHPYPFVFLRMLPDDTLVSMASGLEEPCYGFNLISYRKPGKREGFHRFSDAISRALARLYGARPHWGKYYSLGREDTHRLYPDLQQFRELCRQYDPEGVFQNNFTRDVLGFGR